MWVYVDLCQIQAGVNQWEWAALKLKKVFDLDLGRKVSTEQLGTGEDS